MCASRESVVHNLSSMNASSHPDRNPIAFDATSSLSELVQGNMYEVWGRSGLPVQATASPNPCLLLFRCCRPRDLP